MEETQENGYFVLSASQRCWRGGDYNGSWSTDSRSWNFPTRKIAEMFTQNGGLKVSDYAQPWTNILLRFKPWDHLSV